MELRVALDTNRLVDLFQGDRVLAEWLEYCEEVWIPLFVLGEIKAGFQGGTQWNRNELLLEQLLKKATFGILLPSVDTAERYARLFVQLKRAGTPIPDNDLWISALALEHNLALVTRDRHFQHVPQLVRV